MVDVTFIHISASHDGIDLHSLRTTEMGFVETCLCKSWNSLSSASLIIIFFFFFVYKIEVNVERRKKGFKNGWWIMWNGHTNIFQIFWYCGLVGREYAPRLEGRGSNIKNWHLLLPWLAFIIVRLKWLIGVSCLSASWYFSVLANYKPAWVRTSYSRSD